jgi:hypothetical protein
MRRMLQRNVVFLVGYLSQQELVALGKTLRKVELEDENPSALILNNFTEDFREFVRAPTSPSSDKYVDLHIPFKRGKMSTNLGATQCSCRIFGWIARWTAIISHDVPRGARSRSRLIPDRVPWG